MSNRLMSSHHRLSATTMIAVVLALTVIAAGSSGLRGQGPSQEFLLSEGKAGLIEIGMPIDEILQRFGRERVRLIDLAKERPSRPQSRSTFPARVCLRRLSQTSR